MIVLPVEFIRVITLKHKVLFYYEVLWNIRGRNGGVSKKFRHTACGYSYQPFSVLWVYYKYFKGLPSCLAVSGLSRERQKSNKNETGKVIKREGNKIK